MPGDARSSMAAPSRPSTVFRGADRQAVMYVTAATARSGLNAAQYIGGGTMDATGMRGSTATSSETDPMIGRLAAWGGICGAVLVPGALLILCQLVLIE